MKALEIIPIKRPAAWTVSIPGSKSYTHRALFLAALVPHSVEIINPLYCDDTYAMLRCLRSLGIKIRATKTYIKTSGKIKLNAHASVELNVGSSGTALRFLLSLVTTMPGSKKIYGTTGLNRRPVKGLVDALRQLGANIEYVRMEGYPPLRVMPALLVPGAVKLNGSVTSVYLSALLMTAPLIGEMNIVLSTKLVSRPYVQMTIDSMRAFGVRVEQRRHQQYRVPAGQSYQTAQYIVEGDISHASYFCALAVITRSEITIKNFNPASAQADIKFIQILERMGNVVVRRRGEITIMGNGIQAVNVDMEDCPDQVPTLAVLAAFTDGTTKISGISTLRVKETDRVAAVTKGLARMGIGTKVIQNTLIIFGGDPHSASINTYGDSRIAMAFTLAGAKLPGIRIKNPEVTNKTFPEFWKIMSSIGVKTKSIG